MRSFASFSLALWAAALALVIYTFSKLPLAQIGASISALTWHQWVSWALINLLIILIGNLRWFQLNKALGFRVNFLRLLAIKQAGQTISFITPGPQFGGEPLQILWLCRNEKIKTSKAIAALGMDRFCELLVNFSVLLTSVFLLMLYPSAGEVEWIRVTIILALVIVSVLVVGWTIARQPRWTRRFFCYVTTRWQHSPRLQKFNSHWLAFCSDIRSVAMTGINGIGVAILLSILSWVGIVCELWMLLGFLQIAVTLQALLLILVTMRLAMLLPIPGGIGTVEASILWSFGVLNFTPFAALGLIALMRTRDLIVLLGGLGAWLTIRTSAPLKTASETPPSK